jgi:hypothetical protein
MNTGIEGVDSFKRPPGRELSRQLAEREQDAVDGTSRDFLLAVRVSGRQLRRASVAELVEAAGL